MVYMADWADFDFQKGEVTKTFSSNFSMGYILGQIDWAEKCPVLRYEATSEFARQHLRGRVKAPIVIRPAVDLTKWPYIEYGIEHGTLVWTAIMKLWPYVATTYTYEGLDVEQDMRPEIEGFNRVQELEGSPYRAYVDEGCLWVKNIVERGSVGISFSPQLHYGWKGILSRADLREFLKKSLQAKREWRTWTGQLPGEIVVVSD